MLVIILAFALCVLKNALLCRITLRCKVFGAGLKNVWLNTLAIYQRHKDDLLGKALINLSLNFKNFADNKSLHLVRLPLKNGDFQLALSRSCLCKGGILGLRFDKSAPKAASAIRSQNISSYCAKKLCQICQVSKTFHQRHCKARNDNGKARFFSLHKCHFAGWKSAFSRFLAGFSGFCLSI